MGQSSSFAFEDKFLNLENKGVLRYWEAGSKARRGIVFLHGIGSGIESWLNQFEFLSTHFYVIAVDVPGFGKSRIKNDAYNLGTLLNIFDIFFQKKELDKFSFIGHSLGGFLSLEYANTRPDKIEKLILIACGGFGLPSKRFRFLGSQFSQLFFLPLVKTAFLGPKIFKYFYGNGLPIPIYEKLSQHWKDPLVVKSFVKVLDQSDEQKSVNVSAISSPSLIVWGKKDWVLDYRLGVIAESKLPNALLRVFDEYGHGIHTEIPEKINPLILEFLSKTS
jgi:2-hydroxy-6-oxonona-2,4-dienedioate hydrolase